MGVTAGLYELLAWEFYLSSFEISLIFRHFFSMIEYDFTYRNDS